MQIKRDFAEIFVQFTQKDEVTSEKGSNCLWHCFLYIILNSRPSMLCGVKLQFQTDKSHNT